MSIIDDIKEGKEVLWRNPDLKELGIRPKINGYGFVYTKAAQNRFIRFMPYFASAFPETAAKKGNIESELLAIPAMKERMNEEGAAIEGNVFLKDDARLPIAGSVKARGGIHEVLKIAESLAQKAGMLLPTDHYGKVDSDEFRQLYGQYTIQVGSTGNLGVSIGRMSARLGFRAIVHMSQDAKAWKKDLLRKEGVIVKEYDQDYAGAVAKGREESAADDHSFFIDDERSEDLFFGYSIAALRLKVQLFKKNIPVDHEHPLFVYLPCGVGGAPGGITFGLKQMYGDDVHCFFAEPTQSPCLTLGMASGKKNEISVQEIGLSGITVADGLAVGRASGFVCEMMKPLMSGAYTVKDSQFLLDQKNLMETEGIFLEPSACAGFHGLRQIHQKEAWKCYLTDHDLLPYMHQATHVVWGTGGGLMPEELRQL